MDINQAIEHLKKHGVFAKQREPNTIICLPNFSRSEEPTLEAIDNTCTVTYEEQWIVQVAIGQVAIIIQIADALEQAIQAIITFFDIFKSDAELRTNTKKALYEIQRCGGNTIVNSDGKFVIWFANDQLVEYVDYIATRSTVIKHFNAPHDKQYIVTIGSEISIQEFVQGAVTWEATPSIEKLPSAIIARISSAQHQ